MWGGVCGPCPPHHVPLALLMPFRAISLSLEISALCLHLATWGRRAIWHRCHLFTPGAGPCCLAAAARAWHG